MQLTEYPALHLIGCLVGEGYRQNVLVSVILPSCQKDGDISEHQMICLSRPGGSCHYF